MSKNELVILDCWASPFCMRVKIALAEKGLDYEERAEDLFGGKSDLLLTSNPIYKKVPVFLHDGKPLCESSVIVSYIDELFDSTSAIWKASGDDAVESAKKEFVEVLKVLEGALGEKEYFAGDAFGYVDILAIPITSWFLASEKFGNFKVEAECPKLSAWIKRCMEKETVAKVIPDPEKIYEFVVNLRKMFGIA
ncbi:unnamed protein product [Linum tenue]|uniref:glutathione transferase n=1 Tax=Linum tenue TaxID=586396 RepID=A0AAV0NPJ9_9ROSI|nr:unnamed protein product [Linum tenue]